MRFQEEPRREVAVGDLYCGSTGCGSSGQLMPQLQSLLGEVECRVEAEGSVLLRQLQRRAISLLYGTLLQRS